MGWRSLPVKRSIAHGNCVPVNEFLSVGHRFYIRPLLPFFGEQTSFYILAFSQRHARLIAANRFRAHELQPLRREVAGRGRSPITEAHDEPKDRLASYLRKLSAILFANHDEDTRPLVMAALEYVAAIYRT